MDPSSRSDSSVTGQSPRGWSFDGHHTTRSSENPLYNSVGSLGNIVSPPQVVYEELPADNKPSNHSIRPRDYLEPSRASSVRNERVVTNNVLYASVEATSTLPPRSDLNQVYQFAPIEHAYDDNKQISRCSCGWAEAAILSMAVLVILLSVASLILMIMILAGVVSIDRPALTQPTMTTATTDAVVSPSSIQDILMVLRNRIELINSDVNRITNQTAAFQSRFDGFRSQLVIFNQSIQSDDISQPILLPDKANVSINTEQTCVMDEKEVCNLQQSAIACSGGQESVVNQNSGFLTEFSCYLNSTGFNNGSAALVTESSTPTNRSRAFTLEEVQDVGFLQSCFCFLFSSHSETVQCIRRSLRCSLSEPSLPFNVIV